MLLIFIMINCIHYKSNRYFYNYLFRNVSKVEDAIDCYQRAANLFKMAKKWSQAGRAFILAADLNAKSGRKHDAATNYVDSANCFKKTDPNGTVIYLISSTL